MRGSAFHLLWLLALGLSLTAYIFVDELFDDPRDTIARSRAVSGENHVRPRDLSLWRPVGRGQLFYENDVISTGDGSSLEVVFANGRALTLAQNSQIELRLVQDEEERPEIRVTLYRGNLTARSRESGSAALKAAEEALVAAILASLPRGRFDSAGRLGFFEADGRFRVAAAGEVLLSPSGAPGVIDASGRFVRGLPQGYIEKVAAGQTGSGPLSLGGGAESGAGATLPGGVAAALRALGPGAAGRLSALFGAGGELGGVGGDSAGVSVVIEAGSKAFELASPDSAVSVGKDARRADPDYDVLSGEASVVDRATGAAALTDRAALQEQREAEAAALAAAVAANRSPLAIAAPREATVYWTLPGSRRQSSVTVRTSGVARDLGARSAFLTPVVQIGPREPRIFPLDVVRSAMQVRFPLRLLSRHGARTRVSGLTRYELTLRVGLAASSRDALGRLAPGVLPKIEWASKPRRILTAALPAVAPSDLFLRALSRTPARRAPRDGVVASVPRAAAPALILRKGARLPRRLWPYLAASSGLDVGAWAGTSRRGWHLVADHQVVATLPPMTRAERRAMATAFAAELAYQGAHEDYLAHATPGALSRLIAGFTASARFYVLAQDGRLVALNVGLLEENEDALALAERLGHSYFGRRVKVEGFKKN